jgi:DHA1 family tetracycline resistance protein-like MFS transporter
MPIMGALSDRFGRRRVILISNLGLGLDYVLMALAPDLAWLFIGRLLSGATAATIPTASAYIADVTPPEHRAARFGLLSAAFGLGFVVGPALGGWLGVVDPRLPFWVAGVLSLLNTAWGVFVLPESLPSERRAAFSWRTANPLGGLVFLRQDTALLVLGVASLLSFLAHESLPGVFVLYTEHRYGWGEGMTGAALAIVGAAATLVAGFVVGPLVRAIGELRALVLGLACGVVGLLVFAAAHTTAMFLSGILGIAMWGVAGPAMQGLMSRHVDEREQGRLQGALASLRGLTGMAGPILFTQVFAASIGPTPALPWPGAPYLLAAALLGLAIATAWSATRRRSRWGGLAAEHDAPAQP